MNNNTNFIEKLRKTSLYRGKRKDNGKWVYGFYVELTSDKNKKSYRIYNGYAETDCGTFYPEAIEVIPETVGLATGYNNIYTDDIVSSEQDNIIGIVRFGEYTNPNSPPNTCHIGIYIEWQNDKYDLLRKDLGFWVKHRYIKIIGNTHNNPELL